MLQRKSEHKDEKNACTCIVTGVMEFSPQGLKLNNALQSHEAEAPSAIRSCISVYCFRLPSNTDHTTK